MGTFSQIFKGLNMKELRSVMVEYYLDWRNNYLTIDRFAEHNGLTVNQAVDLIRQAKVIFNSPHPEA
jgi:hypothetical protein